MSRLPLTLTALVASLTVPACGPADPPLQLSLYYGEAQRVGHVGDGQRDYNLLGETSARRLSYSLNGAPPVRVSVSHEPFGFRRLGGPGHFNVDLPLAALRDGTNEVLLAARHPDGSQLEQRVTLERVRGSCPLPLHLDWASVRSPEDAGWCVDGRWTVEDGALRSAYPAYDRLFAVGDTSWRDYEVRARMLVDEVAAATGPVSGGNGLGFVFRFQGHVVGGPLEFPDAQPKWGYLPFGAITWLRWRKGAPEDDPTFQFYRGDRNELHDHGHLEFATGTWFEMLASCETLPDRPDGTGRTCYRLKVWRADLPEPEAQAFEVVQESQDALRQGGVALVAHHVSVRVGALTVTPLAD